MTALAPTLAVEGFHFRPHWARDQAGSLSSERHR